jgi:hypothetical protein
MPACRGVDNSFMARARDCGAGADVFGSVAFGGKKCLVAAGVCPIGGTRDGAYPSVPRNGFSTRSPS